MVLYRYDNGVLTVSNNKKKNLQHAIGKERYVYERGEQQFAGVTAQQEGSTGREIEMKKKGRK